MTTETEIKATEEENKKAILEAQIAISQIALKALSLYQKGIPWGITPK